MSLYLGGIGHFKIYWTSSGPSGVGGGGGLLIRYRLDPFIRPFLGGPITPIIAIVGAHLVSTGAGFVEPSQYHHSEMSRWKQHNSVKHAREEVPSSISHRIHGTNDISIYIPKYPVPSKLAILRTKTPLLYRFKPFHWRVQWSLGIYIP